LITVTGGRDLKVSRRTLRAAPVKSSAADKKLRAGAHIVRDRNTKRLPPPPQEMPFNHLREPRARHKIPAYSTGTRHEPRFDTPPAVPST
jgi:hypothetical protein